MQEFAYRLRRGSDLKKELSFLCKDKTAVILSGVGCVNKAHLRLAKAIDYLNIEDHFEIVSLTGTISHSKVHVHIALSDDKGKVIGGHLEEGTIIDTTCELVLGVLDKYDSNREFDKETGYDEIVFREIN